MVEEEYVWMKKKKGTKGGREKFMRPGMVRIKDELPSSMAENGKVFSWERVF